MYGSKTKESITLTVDNADVEIAEVTGVEGLTKDDFDLTGGVLSLTNNGSKVGIAQKPVTLTVNYKKKSTAGANDTLSKTTENITFNIIQVQKFDAQSEIIKNIVAQLGNSVRASSRIYFDFTDTSAATVTEISLKNKDSVHSDAKDAEASSFITDITSDADGITTSIGKNSDYKKYFKDITETHSGVGTDTLTIELTFISHTIYEFDSPKYTIKLDNKRASDNSVAGNWI